MINALLSDFDLKTNELQHAIMLFKQQQINIRAYENHWSAGEIIHHLILSDRDVIKILQGKFTETNDGATEKTAFLAAAFGNMNSKMIAAQRLQPEHKNYSRYDLKSELNDSRDDMRKLFVKSVANHSFEHPELGQLTNVELLQYVILHTKRHISQLRNAFLALPAS